MILVPLGGASGFRLLAGPDDLVEILTVRTWHPVRLGAALVAARALGRNLGGEVSPRILLFSHPWIGVDEAGPVDLSAVHALLVELPGHPARPALASRFGRWEMCHGQDWTGLPGKLGRLLA